MSEDKVRIVIWCKDPEVKKAFRRHAADFDNYEEALKDLLKKVGVYRSDRDESD